MDPLAQANLPAAEAAIMKIEKEMAEAKKEKQPIPKTNVTKVTQPPIMDV